MILLDTNALLWVETGHARARPLLRTTSRLYLSPMSLLEVQFLLECGRIRLKGTTSIDSLVADARWHVDEPPALAWFEEARANGWTRDPFDRLIVAHAIVRGWRLATGDSKILEQLGPRKTLAL